MSEQPPKDPAQGQSNAQTLIFMVVLSFTCALILSLLASLLAEPKMIAKELDRSKQMMIAAKILDHNGYFLMKGPNGDLIPAKYVQDGFLEPGTPQDIPSQKQILEIYDKRLKPLLVNSQGEIFTFDQAKLNEEEYLADNKKTGYYKQPYKLIYKIMPNSTTADEKAAPEGWVIPVNGLGLWDAIYGYLALKPDGVTVTGITWYDQKETPGLGANIAEASWQSLFPGKKIFQGKADGTIDLKTAPIGITVVKGRVAEVYGDSPKANSAVDGMAGATLTGNGVTDGYRDVLEAYRPFLVRLNNEYKDQSAEAKS